MHHTRSCVGQQAEPGVHFLDFCDDSRLCRFTVVVFPSDLKSVGDIRQLPGRIIEIHGRAEVILEEYRQLSGSGARIPPFPKNYDVEWNGHSSAGLGEGEIIPRDVLFRRTRL
jgi:hypothetical protein